MESIGNMITTTENQFGPKRAHFTDMCIYLLKEMVDYYKKHKTILFVCFIDASNAFH